MAVVVDIDPTTGKERHTVGGIVMLTNLFNQYVRGKATAQQVLVDYVQPDNQHVVTIRGRKADGTAFDIKSSPQPANVSLGTVVVLMADQLIPEQESI